MALSRLAIKNMALDELPESRIDSEDEASLAAEELQDAWQPALELLLEDHDWEFATRRVTLAAVTNGRGHEWRYAYAAPSDMARPMRILPYRASDVVSGERWSEVGRLRGFEGAVPYRISDCIIYTTQESAVLEYISNAPSEARFSAKFARALALEMASRVVMPIKKDSKRQRELIAMAELAKDRAKAEDMNRDAESPRDFIPEVQLARMGYGGWPWR